MHPDRITIHKASNILGHAVKRATGVISVLLALQAVGCRDRSASVSYRVTAYLSDGDLVRSGSAVWRNTLTKKILPLTSQFDSKFEAEAIPIELPGRGTLFIIPAYLGNLSRASTLPESSFEDDIKAINSNDKVAVLEHISSLKGETRLVPCGIYMRLGQMSSRDKTVKCLRMGFSGNLSLSSSFRAVDPANIRKSNLGDVRLERIEITIVDESPTKGIANTIPWIEGLTSADGVSTRDLQSRSLPYEVMLMRND